MRKGFAGRQTSRSRPRSTLAYRLVVRYVLTLLGVLLVLGVMLDRTLQDALRDHLAESLEGNALLVRHVLPEASPQQVVRDLGRETRMRITVVTTDGTVLADSDADPARMANHRGRPEIRAALRGDIGVASRPSGTLPQNFLYVALPPADGRIVRVAVPLSDVARRARDLRMLLAGVLAGAAAVGTVVVWLTARRMTRPLTAITDAATSLGAGRLDARAPEAGASDLHLLARTLNRMAEDLGDEMERTRQEQQTREVILATMADGVVLVEPRGGIRYANAAAHSLLGHGGDGSAGFALPDRIARAVQAASHGRTLVEDEVELEDRRIVALSASPVADTGLALLVLREITEARRLEAMRRDFVAAASHELKTPVASIQAAAETLSLALEDDTEAARRFTDQLQREAHRLSRIVMDLLDLSRLETESPSTDPVRFDEIVARELDRCRERAAAAGITVDSVMTAVTVQGSARDLALLVANLVDNALRYTGPSGSVSVSLRLDGADAVLTVSDTGIGIPTRDLPRVFERFYRVDRARSRDTGGTGLGLALVKHVAEQHGARVQAESELGRGSVFTVRLPVNEGPARRGRV